MTLRVQPTPTPLSVDAFAQQFEEAFTEYFQRPPTRAEALWLFVLLTHENADGRSIIAHNWGNVTAPHRKMLHWVPPWVEDTSHRLHNAPNVPKQFAAFHAHKEGAKRWLRLLDKDAQGTHQRILKAAANDGPVEAFQHAVATPHPKTGMVYCVECTTEATRKRYQQLYDQWSESKLFDHLTSEKKSAAVGDNGSSLPSASSDGSQPVLYVAEWQRDLNRRLKVDGAIDSQLLKVDNQFGPLTLARSLQFTKG